MAFSSDLCCLPVPGAGEFIVRQSQSVGDVPGTRNREEVGAGQGPPTGHTGSPATLELFCRRVLRAEGSKCRKLPRGTEGCLRLARACIWGHSGRLQDITQGLTPPNHHCVRFWNVPYRLPGPDLSPTHPSSHFVFILQHQLERPFLRTTSPHPLAWSRLVLECVTLVTTEVYSHVSVVSYYRVTCRGPTTRAGRCRTAGPGPRRQQ